MAINATAFGVGGVQTLVDAPTITLDLGRQAGSIPPNTTATLPANDNPALAAGSGNSYAVTLGGNRTLNILNMGDGQIVRVAVTQDGTGSRTLAVQVNGVATLSSVGTLTTTAGATDMIEVQYRADLGKGLASALGKAYA